MTGIYLLVPTLFAILVSFLIVRAGGIALMMTGLDRKKAVFQALSAFSGTGFTTKESERIINHPKRRQIISILMVLGNVGIVTVIVTATSSLVTSKADSLLINALFLFAGIYVIYRLVRSAGFTAKWEDFIEDRIIKSGVMEEAPVEDLLHLLEGYGLVNVTVSGDSPLNGKSISQFKPSSQKIMVLGIERSKEWMPLPGPKVEITLGDKVTLYGQLEFLRSIV